MAIRPGPPKQRRGSGRKNTAKLRSRPARRSRKPLVALVLALIGLCGLGVAGYQLRGEFKPRTFTQAQQKRIEAWEVAKRWRTMPKAELFPAGIRYHVGNAPDTINLTARRLGVARQATCKVAAGASHRFMSILDSDGCQAVLRSTYTDSTNSFVVTAGIAVLSSPATATNAARFLTGGASVGEGGPTRQLVLRPFRVFGTPAANYIFPQRQLSWAVAAGPYLVMTTVGYADGRPRVRVNSDYYAFQEMTKVARGIAARIAAPLAKAPPVPRCPGVPSC